MVANLWLLTTEVVGEALDLNGIGAEPEEALLETSKLPETKSVSLCHVIGMEYVVLFEMHL